MVHSRELDGVNSFFPAVAKRNPVEIQTSGPLYHSNCTCSKLGLVRTSTRLLITC